MRLKNLPGFNTLSFFASSLVVFCSGLLILNISSIPNNLIILEKPVLSLPADILIGTYYLSLLLISILIAGISYKYFEAWFLKLKEKLHPVTKPVMA